MSFEQGVPSELLTSAEERVLFPEDILASRREVRRLCRSFTTLHIPSEILAPYKISPELFEKIKHLAEGAFTAQGWESWRGIADKILPIFSRLVQEYEGIRRAELNKWHNLEAVAACDAQAIRLLSPDIFSAPERVDIRMKLATLSSGAQLERKVLGDAQSTNAPSRVRLDTEDGGSLTAYVKSRLKEAAFKMDVEEERDHEGNVTKHWHVFRQIFDANTNTFEWQKDDLRSFVPSAEYAESVKELFRQLTSEEFREAVCGVLAKELEISPQDVPYNNEEFNARAGVLPGEMTKREWAVSRFDLLLGMKLVPLTVIRPESGFQDIASVQEAVPSTDERFPSRELTAQEAAQMFELPPEVWADIFPTVDSEKAPSFSPDRLKEEPVRSMVRMGIFAYLMGDLDGIERNCLFDPVSKTFKKIDNGLALGVVTGKTISFDIPQRRGSRKMVETNYVEAVRSVPLELVMRHGLMLDEEAQAYLQGLYERLEKNSLERKQVKDILGVIFAQYGQKMIEYQFKGFMNRLENVVRHGRPVGLQKHIDYMPELEQAFVLAATQPIDSSQAA